MTSEPTPHILVVDDDADIRETSGEILESAGYRVACAADGARALEYLRACDRKPDLILLDLMMPNVDRFQFRERQLQNTADAAVPIVVFTADRNARNKTRPTAGYGRRAKAGQDPRAARRD
jgi:CheY-like chemotaxis protein